MADVEDRKNGNWRNNREPDKDSWDWQLLKGVAVVCKLAIIPEEFDLPPIQADSPAGYIAAGGCDEDMLNDLWLA